jgi:2,3-bisphosphoglycerate-dependent phosphoglycerate mutase
MLRENQKMRTEVVMIRHAQSEWNRAGLFTGWADPALTSAGYREALMAAEALMAVGFSFSHVFSSRLQRAHQTAEIILREMGTQGRPIIEDWRLNERHHGALQGQEKIEVAAEVGEKQVWRWRRGYLDNPPLMDSDDPAHPRNQSRWSDLDRGSLPGSESLAGVRKRVMAFWQEKVEPQLSAGRPLLIASHGNTLRALLMALGDMTVQEIEGFEIPAGIPIAYSFSEEGMPIGWRYLSDTETKAA